MSSTKFAFGMSFDEVLSLWITVAMTGVVLGFLAYFMWNPPPNIFGIAFSAGAVGGFLHEFVQSKGRVLFIQRKDDGIYLGSIAGLILGMVAGILVIGGGVAAGTDLDTLDPQVLLFESFFAGLALKGVGEAATSVPQFKDKFTILGLRKTPSSTAGSSDLHLEIRNNMNFQLELQAIIIRQQPSGNQIAFKLAPPSPNNWLVAGKAIRTIDVGPVSNAQVPAGNYEVTAISINGEEKATFPL
ncbi:MAG: hypothetical protein ACREAZ_11980 [Nitrososphaera sp.]